MLLYECASLLYQIYFTSTTKKEPTSQPVPFYPKLNKYFMKSLLSSRVQRYELFTYYTIPKINGFA